MKQKQGEVEMEPGQKRVKSQFGYKLHSIIYRDYELIRKFKTKTLSHHYSEVNLAKNEVIYRNRGYF